MASGDYINERRQAEQMNSIEQNRGWLMYMAAGLGTIALGAGLLKHRIESGNKTLASIFNFIGLPRGVNLSDVAANTGKSAAKSNTTGIRSILNATFDVNKNRLVLGPIDIIDDLRNSLELLSINGSKQDIASHIAEKTTEYVNRRFVGGGNNVGYFAQGLERVTVGQILEDQATWSAVLGADQFSVLEKARARNLIGTNTVLDKQILYNKGTNEVLDFRLRNLTSSIVPGAAPGSMARAFRFDIFGQGKVLGAAFGTVRSRGIAVLGPSADYEGSRVFIGGEVFGYERTAAGGYNPVLLAKNRSLRRTGDPLELINASRTGMLSIDLPERRGLMRPIGWMEENLGIGPAFATRFNPIERWIINPYRRARALMSGEGTIIRNPYAPASGGNKGFDAVFGADLPELAVGHGAVPQQFGGTSTNIKNLGPLQRLGVIFDLLSNYSVVKTQSKVQVSKGIRNTLIGSDLIVPPKTGSYQILGKTIPSRSGATLLTDIRGDDLTAAGYKSQSKRYGYYDVEDSRLGDFRDLSTYMLQRLNSLFSESFLGIAPRPDHRFFNNLLRTAAIPVVYEAGRQAALYVDHSIETVTGISPIKTLGSIYAGARVVQQKLREFVGIQPASAFLDKYFPGSINSDGSTLIRSLVAPLAVATGFLKHGMFGKALLGAAATYAAIGGPEPDQTASDLISEYSGDKKVPVRKGRLWGLGYLPLFGGKAERYETSWYPRLTSEYRDKSLYGSESEYWAYHANVYGIPFPTPSNLFGLLNILNPYRLENRHAGDRPYSVTSSPLNSFPIFGPMLGATVGQLFKPNSYRAPSSMPLLEAGLAAPGLSPSHAQALGIPSINATALEAEDPATALSILARQANIASEPLGVYKFAMEFFGIKLDPQLGGSYADSNMMQDPGRQLYDANLGGLFGQTEMIRRFMINDYSSDYRRAAAINPIKNTMPSWLPGKYSEVGRDSEYFTDFTQGDPFVKIEDGESRLPGVGYEAVNKLHSGSSGIYDAVDRFLILSDIAPYSASYKKYEKIVDSMQLDPAWMSKVEQAKIHRQEVIGVDTRYKRYEEEINNLNMNTLAQAAYAPVRKAYDFLTHDILANIPVLGSKLFPFRSPLEQYRKMYVEGSEYASWDRPYEDIIRPAIYDMALSNPAMAAVKGFGIGYFAGGPMRWFNPIKALTNNSATPYIGAAVGASLSAGRILTLNDQNMIPYHVRGEEDAIQYMDSINYIKGRMGEEVGGGARDASKTMMGATNIINYRSALPRSSDRRYFDYFLSQEDEGIRSQIMKSVPDYMSRGLAMAWNQDFYNREESDALALSFVNNEEIPSADWMGWSPEVSAPATRLRLVDHGINGISSNIHRFGFYESHQIDLKTRLSKFNDQEINFVQSPMYSSFDSFIGNQIKSTSGGRAQVRRFSTPNGSRREIDYFVD